MRALSLGLALLALPLCSHGQSYADPPFSVIDTVPASAHVEGWEHGTTHANGVTIDLSESQSAIGFDEIRGWSLGSWVDRDKPEPTRLFHDYIQYDHLGVTFAYNLLAEPIHGTDQIRCTFSALTDPANIHWPRDKYIVPVALPADLKPIIIHSGQVIAIATYPVGKDKPAVIHYVRLTRMDATHREEAQTE